MRALLVTTLVSLVICVSKGDSGAELSPNSTSYGRRYTGETKITWRNLQQEEVSPLARSVVGPLAKSDDDKVSLLGDPDAKILIPGIYYNCWITKACVSPNKDNWKGKDDRSCLQRQNCRIVLAYGGTPREFDYLDDENEILVEIHSRETSHWIAFGISNKRKPDYTFSDMYHAFVVEGVRDPQPALFNSYNLPCKNLNKRLKRPNQQFVRLISSRIEIDTFYCRLALKKHIEFKVQETEFKNLSGLCDKKYGLGQVRDNDTVKFDLTQGHTILFAWGEYSENGGQLNGELGKHGPDNKRVTSREYILSKRYAPNKQEVTDMKIHAYMGYFAYAFLMPLGLFIPRYYKETYGYVRFCGIRLWHLAHVGLMSGALMLIVASVTVQAATEEKWTAIDPSIFHTVCGCFSYTLFLMSYCLGFPSKATALGQQRHWVSKLHSFLGYTSHATGMSIFVVADRMDFSKLPCAFKYIAGVWWGIFICFQIMMTYHLCWVDWVIGISARGFNPFCVQMVYKANEDSKKVLAPRATASANHGIYVDLDPDTESRSPIQAPGMRIRLMLLSFMIFLGIFYSAWGMLLLHADDGDYEESSCYDSSEVHRQQSTSWLY